MSANLKPRRVKYTKTGNSHHNPTRAARARTKPGIVKKKMTIAPTLNQTIHLSGGSAQFSHLNYTP